MRSSCVTSLSIFDGIFLSPRATTLSKADGIVWTTTTPSDPRDRSILHLHYLPAIRLLFVMSCCTSYILYILVRSTYVQYVRLKVEHTTEHISSRSNATIPRQHMTSSMSLSKTLSKMT
jgi:hypothetical protein